MKHGYMPYRGLQRERFINRVANYKRLNHIAKAYNSAFWDIIDIPYSAEHNESILFKCITNLNFLSGKKFNQVFKLVITEVNLKDKTFINNLNSDLSDDDELGYEDALDSLFSGHEICLDTVAFIAALFRESLYFGKPDLAKKLRDYYSFKLVLFFCRYRIEQALIDEMVEVSLNRILTLNKFSNFSFVKDLQAEAVKSNEEVNSMLENFLLYHQYLLTGKSNSH